MNYLLLFPILIPIFGAIIQCFINNKYPNFRKIILELISVITFVIVFINLFIDFDGLNLLVLNELLVMRLRADFISKFFSFLIAFIYMLITFYSSMFMEDEIKTKTFYLFYFLTLAMLIAMSYASNLLTIYVFFEFISLFSTPLVLHLETKEAFKAAKKYLFYSLSGAFLALIGIFYLINFGFNSDFILNGQGVKFIGNQTVLQVIILITILGFSVKCGLFPMQSWLVKAHPIALSNASALLSGIITKAGVLAIIRVLYFVVNPSLIANSFAQIFFMILALISILLGSILAFIAKNFKKRLAFSSISQLSYILVSLSLLSKAGLVASLVQIITHMFCKVGLFLFAGIIIKKYNFHSVLEMKGLAKILPIESVCFIIISLCMIGLPWTIGFFAKWEICLATLEFNIPILKYSIIVILIISALLTAAYLLTVAFNLYFAKNSFPITLTKKSLSFNYMGVVLVIISIIIVFLGFFSRPLINFISALIGG